MCHSGPCENGASCVGNHKNYTCICSKGWEGKNCEITYIPVKRPRIQAIDFSCNGTADKEQGTINTPNYPDYYDNNNLCTWLISSSHRIKLVFTTFSLESSYDFLYAYDGSSKSSTLLGIFDGYLPGQVVESSSERLFLEFTSDGSYTEQGFLIRLEATL